MKKHIQLLLVGLLMVALVPVRGAAQATASGTIQGTVTDPSGAVVVGAQVQATQRSTGTVRTTTSSDSGSFRFDLLPASLYEVKVTKVGFGSFVQRAELLVGTTVSVNASLRPGATTEVIEVTAGAPLVDTEKTGVSQSVTPSQVEDLPLIGRDGRPVADHPGPLKDAMALIGHPVGPARAPLQRASTDTLQRAEAALQKLAAVPLG